MVEYLQDYDSRTLKLKAMRIMRYDYIITTIHKIAGEILLKHKLTEAISESRQDDNFVYIKDLDRRMDLRTGTILECEENLGIVFSETHSNFMKYINSLNLPSKLCSKQFEFLNKETSVDLVYHYNPAEKGSKILTREVYEAWKRSKEEQDNI